MINEKDFIEFNKEKFSVDCVYIHTCFQSLFSGMLNWLGDVLYKGDVKYKVIATYDKAVEVFKKKQQNLDGQVNTNFMPALTLDPMLDFSNEERAGRFPWMFRNLDSQWRLKPWNSIRLVDQGVTITPMFTRYQGTVEVTAWLSSIYQFIDFRTKMIQYCGGYNRWIRPECFWTHLIIPKEILYGSDGTQAINWDAINPNIITLETTATKEYALPFQLDAIWRLDSCGDSSNKMGADQLAEYKFNSTFTWECNIPTFIRFENYQFPIETINLNVGMTPTQAKYPLISGFGVFKRIDPYKQIVRLCNSRCIYNIIKTENTKPCIIMDNTMCKSYPETYLNYNHYVVGKIYDITKLNSPDDIKNIESILVIDQYKEEYIPYMRKCRGLVSRFDSGKNPEFMEFLREYHISCIYKINTLKLFKAFQSLHNKDVTFDPISKVVYLGTNEIKRWTPQDNFKEFDFNHNIIKIIHEMNLEEEVKDLKTFNVGQINIVTKMSAKPVKLLKKFECTKGQHTFNLGVIIQDKYKDDFTLMLNGQKVELYNFQEFDLVLDESIEVNDHDTLELHRNSDTYFRSVNLICNHLMTKQDEVDYINSKKLITVNLEELRVRDYDYIYCVSYNGLMNIDSDYIVDEQTKTITFNIEPHRDCYIQIYG